MEPMLEEFGKVAQGIDYAEAQIEIVSNLSGRLASADELRERTATRPRSARFDWGDGQSRIHVSLTAKGEAKTTAALIHERLPDSAEAERMKAFWRERVAGLKEVLEA